MLQARRSPSIFIALLLAAGACDSTAAAPAADPKADAKAKEDADAKARIEKRKQEREAKEAAGVKEKADIAAKILEISVIPEGTKIPKKIAEACEMVVKAQGGFMKKFHPQVEESGVTTQLGLLSKQCLEMGNIKVALCQKFALEATTDLVAKSINEYLPTCMAKYGDEAGKPAGK